MLPRTTCRFFALALTILLAVISTPHAFGRFAAGAFFAVNNDASVAAFQWKDIAATLGLRSDCR